MELSAQVRDAVRDLTLVLADSKRLLGMRYAGWMLGAPEIEAGIACASMAQDEWGHGRLLYALLKEFGDDPDAFEHGREPAAYRNVQALDVAPDAWAALVALNMLVDTALTVQLEALRGSSWTPLAQRVGKMLDEEQFHAAHAAAWAHWFARTGDAGMRELRGAVGRIAPVVSQWFGPDSDRARALVDEGVLDAAGSTLRERYLARIAPLLASVGADGHAPPSFDRFDEATRRVPGSAPDGETIRNVRGDRNRVFLMD
jgi:ring-1,2-phenylacetyl-CoA epoxidase subunit PaaC